MITVINKAVLRLLADIVVDGDVELEEATAGLCMPDKYYVVERWNYAVFPFTPTDECLTCDCQGVV